VAALVAHECDADDRLERRLGSPGTVPVTIIAWTIGDILHSGVRLALIGVSVDDVIFRTSAGPDVLSMCHVVFSQCIILLIELFPGLAAQTYW
jgi:hypothetical protein